MSNNHEDDVMMVDAAASSAPATPRSNDTEASSGGVATAQPKPAQQHQQPQSKYVQLLAVIEEMGKDIRPTYAGSKTSTERLKRGIVQARILVRECLMECERAART